jgi:menaquinone-dependent protoporphyrinogen oxidase
VLRKWTPDAMWRRRAAPAERPQPALVHDRRRRHATGNISVKNARLRHDSANLAASTTTRAFPAATLHTANTNASATAWPLPESLASFLRRPSDQKGSTMANILVLYCSRWGHTKKVAERIASTFWEEGHTARLVDAESSLPFPEVAAFDAACMGAPLYSGQFPAALADFVARNHDWLATVPTLFFSVGLLVAGRDRKGNGGVETQLCIDRFFTAYNFWPSRIELVAGALPYSKYSRLMRHIMRWIEWRTGGETNIARDYEYTDWFKVDHFTQDFSVLLNCQAQSLRDLATPSSAA